jgi:hypothetical protein
VLRGEKTNKFYQWADVFMNLEYYECLGIDLVLKIVKGKLCCYGKSGVERVWIRLIMEAFGIEFWIVKYVQSENEEISFMYIVFCRLTGEQEKDMTLHKSKRGETGRERTR